jgi:hypothetical protein
MRTSDDTTDKNGIVSDGYDYNLQVWVRSYIILDCGHPTSMKQAHCCNAHRLAGRDIRDTQGHEVRP